MVSAMNKTGMRTAACLSLALWSAGAAAEKRLMTNPAFGCPSAYETSRVLQMRREGLGVDGHVTDEVDKASRLYMAEHKCRFLKKGDLVDFEWSNVQKLEPETLGHAVCIRLPNSDECAYTPKNFAEARSTSAQNEVASDATPTVTPGPAAALPRQRAASATAPRALNPALSEPAPLETTNVPQPPQVANSASAQIETPAHVEIPSSSATAPMTSPPLVKARPKNSGRIELSPL